jgi:hypothetical protein
MILYYGENYEDLEETGGEEYKKIKANALAMQGTKGSKNDIEFIAKYANP